MMFRKRKNKGLEGIEERFQQAVDLFKDLDKKEFNRLIDGIKLAWEGYNKIRQVQTVDEKEMLDVSGVQENIDYKEM